MKRKKGNFKKRGGRKLRGTAGLFTSQRNNNNLGGRRNIKKDP